MCTAMAGEAPLSAHRGDGAWIVRMTAPLASYQIVVSGKNCGTAAPLWEDWTWLAQRFDYRGCWSFPVFAAGEAFIGSLAVSSRQPRDATGNDVELATLLTQTAYSSSPATEALGVRAA